MKHPLEKLRNSFNKIDGKAVALTLAIARTKQSAQQLAAEMKLNNSDDFSDLEAMDNCFLSQQRDLANIESLLTKTENHILDYYQNGKPLDWAIKLHPGKLFDGWHRRNDDGNIALIDKELCRAEVNALGKVFPYYRVKIISRPEQNAYCLNFEYSVYRNICWSEMSGEKIIEKLGERLGKQAENISKLRQYAVLQ